MTNPPIFFVQVHVRQLRRSMIPIDKVFWCLHDKLGSKNKYYQKQEKATVLIFHIFSCLPAAVRNEAEHP